MGIFRTLLIAAAGLVLTACAGANVETFEGKSPVFRLEEYFAGNTRAWGFFEDRFGNVRRQFVVDLNGVVAGDTLTLTEDFLYDDGETERRVWVIRTTGEHTYTGHAGGVIGEAAGKAHGNAVNWSYDFALKVDDGTWDVHFDDWLYLEPGGVVLNRARITKFGFLLGEVILSFSKPGQNAALPTPATLAAAR